VTRLSVLFGVLVQRRQPVDRGPVPRFYDTAAFIRFANGVSKYSNLGRLTGV
jgi:hypothetical protein